VESLLIKYLGAEDTEYVRAVTRKTFVAAVARIFEPGKKFDSILVMDGPQGEGKSTLFNRLVGDEWYNDGLTLTDMQDKTGAEKLQGFWIMEIAELSGMKKAEIESVKAFISRKDDMYRPSYGRVVESHRRQSIIIATVNGMGGYLRDPSGNRRFWPVRTPGGSKQQSWDITDAEIEQVWAEVLSLYQSGEKLYLEGELKHAASFMQNEAREADPREGMVQTYLDTPLPPNWDTLDLYQRREYLRDPNSPVQPEGETVREQVCCLEILAECLDKNPSAVKPATDSREVAAILQALGWERTGKTIQVPIYGRQRMWNKQTQEECSTENADK